MGTIWRSPRRLIWLRRLARDWPNADCVLPTAEPEGAGDLSRFDHPRWEGEGASRDRAAALVA
jgi:hypothetical protein